MKLDARRIPRFLDNPGSCRFVLLYGEDAGLVRHRAQMLTDAVMDGPADPFRLVWLNRDEVARLPEEVAALALTGGRRIVRVREAGDAVLGAVRAAAAGAGDALVLLEAPDLSGRSKLRSFIEDLPDGAALACYPEEGPTLDAAIRAVMAADGIAVPPEALEWLRLHLGADHGATRAELEKLALYVGAGGEAGLDAAEVCVGEAAALSLDDALFAASAGDAAGTDRALGLAFGEGTAAVGALRAATYHFQRLHRARLAMDVSGLGASEAAKQGRPPIFFRRQPAFAKALGAWSAGSLLRALHVIADGERECKRTGAPDVTLCRHVFGQLARQAASGRARM